MTLSILDRVLYDSKHFGQSLRHRTTAIGCYNYLVKLARAALLFQLSTVYK